MNRPSRKFDAIKTVLQRERDAISSADFELLEELVHRKEQLLSSLDNLGADELSELKTIALTNHRLLGAAIKGIQSAQRRLKQIVDASKGFTTYDTAGRSCQISSRASSIEKKA